MNVSLDHSNSIRDLSKVSRVANAKGFHSFQLSKRNLFIENFQSQNLVQKNNSPDRTKFTHYFTERTGQSMNAEFKRMRQVCCHIGMESVTSARDGSAWVRLVDIKRRVIQVHEYS